MKVTERKPISYKLLNINTYKFIFSFPPKILEDGANELVNFSFDPKIMFNIKEDFILIKFTIKANIKQNEEYIMEIETNFIFKVENLKDYVVTKKTTTEFKDEKDLPFLASIIGLSYSTMRGIILEKCKGTILEQNILPAINPMTFINSKKI
jgi:hypothetical protein